MVVMMEIEGVMVVMMVEMNVRIRGRTCGWEMPLD